MMHETLLSQLDGVIAFFEEDNALFAKKERAQIQERNEERQRFMESYTYLLDCLKKDLPKDPEMRARFAEKFRKLDVVLTQNQAYLATMVDAFTTLVDILKKDMFAKKDMPPKRYGQVGKTLYSAQAPFVSVRQAF